MSLEFANIALNSSMLIVEMEQHDCGSIIKAKHDVSKGQKRLSNSVVETFKYDEGVS
jgi:hypothetical protein